MSYPDMLNRTRKRVVSLDIDLITYKSALAWIIDLAKTRTSAYVCFANVHMTIEAYLDKNFADQVNNSSLVVADGVPVAKSLKFLHQLPQERIAGMDIFDDIIKSARQHNLKLFFFGTTPDILNKIEDRITRDFPGTQIAGTFSPPFDKDINDESYIDLIRSSGANLVFVALGCPKQEKWMASHSFKIDAPFLGVGGAFPVFAGVTKRAPAAIQNLGLEWLFRLSQEPARLFKRYLKTNTLFIYLLLKWKFRYSFRKSLRDS